MATFTSRGKNQWRVRIRRRGHPVQTKTFETKADAEAWARQIENEMDRGIFVSRAEAEKTTLKEALDRYIEEYIPRLKECQRETNRASNLQKRDISCKIMASIRSKDIADFRKEREAEGVKGNTIRLDFALISHLFNYARSEWGMECLQNPVELAVKPKVDKGRERRLEKEEEKKLLKFSALNFKNVIRFALATAMRREEIASLKWKNVNIEERYLLLPDTKNGEARTIPLSVEALQILSTLPHNESQQEVFSMTSGAITQAMQAACKKANLENLHFHDLRHEATSRLFENTDLDLMEIRAITGHKTLQMLVRYTHLRTARLADRLAGATRVAVTA
jgi:integrase